MFDPNLGVFGAKFAQNLCVLVLFAPNLGETFYLCMAEIKFNPKFARNWGQIMMFDPKFGVNLAEFGTKE